MKTYLQIFFLLLFSVKVFAQQPVSVHLTEKDGLPDKEFYDIVEGDDGIIWFAADKGLFSYNGSEFTSHTHKEQVGLSVFSLTKDNENRIWFTNLANQVFYINSGKVELFLNLKKYFKGTLFSIADYKNSLVLFTPSKILIINKVSKEIKLQKEYPITPSFNSSPIIKNDSIFFESNNEGFTIIDKKLNISRTPKNEIRRVFSGFGALKYLNNSFLLSANLKDGKTFHLLKKSKNDKKQLSLDLPLNTRIYNLEIIDSQLFYSTNNGVFIYELKDELLKFKEQLLPNILITKTIKDSQNNLWLTTLKEGVYIIPNREIKTNFRFDSSNYINKIFKGSSNELFILGKKNEIYRFNNLKKIDTFHFNLASDIKYLFYNPKNNYYYFKMIDDLMDSYLLKDNSFQLINKHNIKTIKDHTFINESEILFATGSLIYKTSITKNNQLIPDFTEKIRGYACYYENNSEKSYFSTVEGVFVYDKEFKNKTEIKFNNKSIYIKDIVALNNGKDLYMLSFKNGLYKISDHNITNYTTNNGLLSNTNSFIKTLHNSVWIAGENGIQQFDTKLNTFKNLTQKDGVPSYNFTGLEIINDIVYVSTQKELFSFNINKVFKTQEKKQFHPYFTSVSIDDKKQLLQSKYKLINNTQRVTIAYNTNGFLASDNIIYKYRLFDTDEKEVSWQTNLSGNNLINYNRLSEGNYTFQLKAINDKNESEIIELTFIVPGVFYKQWWFYYAVTLSTMFLFYVYVNKQKNRFKEKQHLILEKQNKEIENTFLKLESLRNQMNPHFVFNALNSIQDYIINNQKNLAADYLGRFADLIRMYLDQSTKEEISLSVEIKTIEGYLELEKLRFEEKLNYKIIIQDHLSVDTIFIPTAFIQPYVENALKHGLLHKKKPGTLILDFSLNATNDCLIVFIKDNGVGRKKAEEIKLKQLRKHKSFATEATSKRLALLNYNKNRKIEIIVEDLNADLDDVGTKVTLKIPV